jgi:hypothetical protein
LIVFYIVNGYVCRRSVELILDRVKEQRNITHRVKRRETDWIGYILRKNCLLKHSSEGKIETGIEVDGVMAVPALEQKNW